MELILENVTKKYKDKTAIPNVNAQLHSGQLIGLIGKNGAGKTTLLKLLSTIIKPTSGRILLDNQDIVKNPICALLGNPQIIILDEPTAGLDPEERTTVRNILSGLSKEKIVILSTHIVSDIEAVASRILMLQHGNLIFNDSPKALIAKAKGCVWEYTLSSLQWNIKGVSSMVQTEAGVHIRQVSREMPEQQAVCVNSTLEDACLLVLEG